MKKGDGMTTYTFRVVVQADEDRWRAYSPALEAQGASTWGYTEDEAIQNIREVLEMITAELAEEGKAVPSDAAPSEEYPKVASGSPNSRAMNSLPVATRSRGLSIIATRRVSARSGLLTGRNRPRRSRQQCGFETHAP
jgi:predicted RNase H-like HicB family nuclease